MGNERLEELLQAVKKKKAYADINDDFVRWVGTKELEKWRFKDAVKQTRAKLHQVAGAYLGQKMDFTAWSEILRALPSQLDSPELREFCLSVMDQHVSTRERAPFLADFYNQILEPVGTVHSILDVGCGLNTLALPWMPLNDSACYFGLDIYENLVEFSNRFLSHVRMDGKVRTHSMTSGYPDDLPPVQVALLLKTIPCLEQLDKSIPLVLLEKVRAENVVVSFPVHSLSGRSKGMPDFYAERFLGMIRDKAWRVSRFDFSSELVFLVQT